MAPAGRGGGGGVEGGSICVPLGTCSSFLLTCFCAVHFCMVDHGYSWLYHMAPHLLKNVKGRLTEVFPKYMFVPWRFRTRRFRPTGVFITRGFSHIYIYIDKV